jgi:ABC-type lipoprotein export system ATPase subunit
MVPVKKVLNKSNEPLTCSVVSDEFIAASEKAFDCRFNGVSEFYPWELPTDELLNDFSLGVIVGGSGTGKSTLLKQFGKEQVPIWKTDKAIVSHFDSPDDAINKLSAVGLNTVPNWYKPYQVLSNGEKFRADLARKVKNGAVIDEFTSVVDRTVAKAASVALSRYIKKQNLKNIVVSTCHHDIVDWLQPDWVINTDTGHLYDGFFLSDQKSISKYIKQSVVSGKCLKTITI